MPERRASVAALRPGLRCLVVAVLGVWLAIGPAASAAGQVARIALLPVGSRASLVVEIDDAATTATATAVEATDDRAVAVEIGPVHGRVPNQLLRAPLNSPLVSQVRVRGVTHGSDGTIITIYVTAKTPVSGFVRRAPGRVYIDLVPRDASRAAARDVRDTTARQRAPSATPAPVRQAPVPATSTATRSRENAAVRRPSASREQPPARTDITADIGTIVTNVDEFAVAASANSVPPATAPAMPTPVVGAAAAAVAVPTDAAVPIASDESFANEFRSMKTDLMQIARAAGGWNGGQSPAAFDTLSTVLPRLHSLQPPTKMSSAYLTMCASLDELVVVWASSSMAPIPPGELRVVRRAVEAIDDLLQLERRIGRAPAQR